MPRKILEILTTNLDVTETEIYYVDGPIDLGRLKYLNADRPDLKDAPYVPVIPRGLRPETKQDIFARIKHHPILLHHPYDSFQPVIEFLRQAARDPDVMAIKATLYRVGKNSPIVQALLDAIENGKQVATLVELKARFDEESNIEWAKSLESEGVNVVYGLPGLKVHCKVLLVVRREGDKMRRYLHLGTGNYNAVTARLYTDLGLLISDEVIGADATELFNYLTGYSAEQHFQKLMVAPFTIRQRMTELIEREIRHKEKGHDAHLIFKMNALEDPGMIELLYKAARAGVKMDLFVRGTCCLRPGIPGLSENVRVISIIGPVSGTQPDLLFPQWR
jgi:polyphosphate kinase